MNKNHDNRSGNYGDSSTPSSQPGDANSKSNNPGATAGIQQNRNQPSGQSQNQPQKQNLSEQQQLLQKPNPQGGGQPSGGNQPGAASATGKQGAQGQGHSDAECQEAMKKMEEAGKVGPNHKALEPLVGSWKAEVKCWKPDGSGEPHSSQGTASAKWILQGRFLQEDFSGEMMGKPFKGITLLGYDNVKQAYTSVWMADTQTSIFTSEGKGGSNPKEITLEGEANCPLNGPQQVKSVYRILDQNRHVFEMHNGGKKTLEVTYTRQ